MLEKTWYELVVELLYWCAMGAIALIATFSLIALIFGYRRGKEAGKQKIRESLRQDRKEVE